MTESAVKQRRGQADRSQGGRGRVSASTTDGRRTRNGQPPQPVVAARSKVVGRTTVGVRSNGERSTRVTTGDGGRRRRLPIVSNGRRCGPCTRTPSECQTPQGMVTSSRRCGSVGTTQWTLLDFIIIRPFPACFKHEIIIAKTPRTLRVPTM